MDELYFANKVFVKREFLSYAKYHSDQIGCDIGNFYYLDREVYAFTRQDDKYVDFEGNVFSEFDAKTDKEFVEFLSCDDCTLGINKDPLKDCDKTLDDKFVCVGLANIEMLTKKFGRLGYVDSIRAMSNYNYRRGYNDSKSKDKYVSIGDIVYDQRSKDIYRRVKKRKK